MDCTNELQHLEAFLVDEYQVCLERFIDIWIKIPKSWKCFWIRFPSIVTFSNRVKRDGAPFREAKEGMPFFSLDKAHSRFMQFENIARLFQRDKSKIGNLYECVQYASSIVPRL